MSPSSLFRLSVPLPFFAGSVRSSDVPVSATGKFMLDLESDRGRGLSVLDESELELHSMGTSEGVVNSTVAIAVVLEEKFVSETCFP